MTISRGQLRAARMLLCLSQDELATMADVGVATIRRYETGRDVAQLQVEILREAVEAAGVILLGGDVGGRRIGDGVALAADDELPEVTRRRMGARVTEVAALGTRGSGRPAKVRETPEPKEEGRRRRRRSNPRPTEGEGAQPGGTPATEADGDPATAATR